MSDRVILSDNENFRACRRFTLNLAWSTYVNTLDSSTLFLKLVRYSVISMWPIPSNEFDLDTVFV